MAKLTLNDIESLANSASARQVLNDNFTEIEAFADNTLSRDGSTPNQMEADIDLNENDLLNVNRIDASEFYRDGVLLEQSVAYGNKLYDLFSGTGAQTDFPLQIHPGSLGNLEVSVGGDVKRPGLDYNFNGTTLIFTVAPAVGTNNILVRYDQALPVGVSTADSILYTPPSTSLSGTIREFLDSLWTAGANAGAALVRFLQAGSGATARTVQDKLREVVSVADFGAIGDGVTDDTAAFAAALLVGKRVYVPPTENFYRIDELVLEEGRVLYGSGSRSLIKPHTAGASSVLILETGANDIEVFDLTFQVDTIASPTMKVIYGETNERVSLHDLYFIQGGGFAISMDFQSETIIERVRVDSAAIECIQFITASRCQILDCVVNLTGGSGAAIEINYGFICKIAGCFVEGAGVFGYHLDTCDRCAVIGCASYNTDREGINVEDSFNCLVSDNILSWDGTTSLDFGLSLYAPLGSASYNTIANNVIVLPFKSGICLDGSLGNVVGCQVIGNRIYNCNLENAATGAGVLLFGANVSNTVVSDNLFDDTVGKLKYGVNAGGASTNSSIRNNRIINATTAMVARDNGIVAINGEMTKDYAATVASGTGTITSYTVNRASYYELEKMVFVAVDITITNNGTGATNVNVSLPFTASTNTFTMAGRETVTGGFMLSGIIVSTGTNISLTKVDATYPGGTGNRLVVSGWYERG